MYWNEETIAYINEKLKATWSPEQITGAKAPVPVPSWRTAHSHNTNERNYKMYLDDLCVHARDRNIVHPVLGA